MVAVQVLALALVIPLNESLCSAPYMESLQSVVGMGALHLHMQDLMRLLPVRTRRTFYSLGSHQVGRAAAGSQRARWAAPRLLAGSGQHGGRHVMGAAPRLHRGFGRHRRWPAGLPVPAPELRFASCTQRCYKS